MSHSVMIAILCLSAFLLASGLFILGFRQGRAASSSAKFGLVFFALGTLALTLASLRASQDGVLNHDLHSIALWFATAIGWMSMIAWFVWQMRLIGAFTAPLIALTLLVDAFFAGSLSSENLINTQSSPLLSVHIASAIIGQTFAIAACGSALLMLWQERKLKSRQVSAVPSSFPAMDTLSQALSRCLWIGFVFITLGLLTGAVIARAYQVPETFSLSTKAAWAIMVWGWYLTILVLQNILSYRPHKIARMSLIGFGLLALSWFGMAFAHNWSGP